MKLIDFIRHLELYECYLLREGGNHSIYMNTQNDKISAVPRHREIKDFLAKKICHCFVNCGNGDSVLAEPLNQEKLFDFGIVCGFSGQIRWYGTNIWNCYCCVWIMESTTDSTYYSMVFVCFFGTWERKMIVVVCYEVAFEFGILRLSIYKILNLIFNRGSGFY